MIQSENPAKTLSEYEISETYFAFIDFIGFV